MKKRSKVALVVVVVVALFLMWITTGTQGKEVPYLSVQELKSGNYNQDRFRLGGIVKGGSIHISENNLLAMNFVLEQGEETIKVYYHKTRPDLFEDGCEVIVEGEYRNGEFYADNLMTKCASRYEGDLRNAESYNPDEI